MKFLVLTVIAMTLATPAMAADKKAPVKRKPGSTEITHLSGEAGKALAAALRKAHQTGNQNVKFEGGPNVTTYTAGNVSISCFFQNSDDSADCTINPASADQ